MARRPTSSTSSIPTPFRSRGPFERWLRIFRPILKSGLAGSRVHGEDGEYHQTAFRFPTILSEFESGAATGPISRMLRNYIVAMPEPEEALIVDWLVGASLMVRHTVFEEPSGALTNVFSSTTKKPTCASARVKQDGCPSTCHRAASCTSNRPPLA